MTIQHEFEAIHRHHRRLRLQDWRRYRRWLCQRQRVWQDLLQRQLVSQGLIQIERGQGGQIQRSGGRHVCRAGNIQILQRQFRYFQLRHTVIWRHQTLLHHIQFAGKIKIRHIQHFLGQHRHGGLVHHFIQYRQVQLVPGGQIRHWRLVHGHLWLMS